MPYFHDHGLSPLPMQNPYTKFILAIKTLSVDFFFKLINALRPSQQQWSSRDVASILWDLYPTLGCHDTQNALHKYNHPTKPIRLIRTDGLTKPRFLHVGRLRHFLYFFRY